MAYTSISLLGAVAFGVCFSLCLLLRLLRLVLRIAQVAAAVGDHDDFDGVEPQAVHDAITLINHFADVGVVGFWHESAALRKLRQIPGGVQQSFDERLRVSGRILRDVIADVFNVEQRLFRPD